MKAIIQNWRWLKCTAIFKIKKLFRAEPEPEYLMRSMNPWDIG